MQAFCTPWQLCSLPPLPLLRPARRRPGIAWHQQRHPPCPATAWRRPVLLSPWRSCCSWRCRVPPLGGTGAGERATRQRHPSSAGSRNSRWRSPWRWMGRAPRRRRRGSSTATCTAACTTCSARCRTLRCAPYWGYCLLLTLTQLCCQLLFMHASRLPPFSPRAAVGRCHGEPAG